MSIFSKPISASQLSALATKSDVTAAVEEVLAGLVPTAYPGTVQLFRGATVPAGWARISGIPVDSYAYSVPRVSLLSYTATATGSLSTFAASSFALTTAGLHTLNASASGGHRIYQPSTDSWSTRGVYPGTVAGASYIGAGTRVFAYGITGLTAAVLAFDTATGLWGSASPLPEARRGVGAVQVDADSVLLIGGDTAGFGTAASLTSTVWTYQLSTGAYQPHALAPVAMGRPRLVRLASGRIFVTARHIPAGANTTSASPRCWLYTPGSDTWLEVDPIPATLTVSAAGGFYAVGERIVHIPGAEPTAGARGRIFDPSAPAGSQWSDFVVSLTAGMTYGAVNADTNGSTGDGLLLPTGMYPTHLNGGSAGVFAGVSLDAPVTFGGDLFYAIKL